MPEQLYCNGKVIFLYNDLTPPAKQVVFGFGHFRFSEHEKLQCPQQAKAHKKSTPKGVSPLSVLLLFPLIVKYKKHNYFWMGGVSIISGTLFRVRREPFPTSKITMLIINVCCLHLYYTIYFRHCQYLRFLFFHCTNVYLSLNLGYHTSKKHINIDHLFPTLLQPIHS